MLTEKSCADFVQALSARVSVPGGGSAAALVGALGAALCSMAGNFTLGRKKYADVEPDIRHLLKRGEAIRIRLLELVEEDAAAFEPLSYAYSIPKEDPDRDSIIESAAVSACKAPLEIMEQSCLAISLLEEMLEKGSKMLISDVGCGALCCQAALECSGLNVLVNTKILKNRTDADSLNARADLMLSEYAPKAERIARIVSERLRLR